MTLRSVKQDASTIRRLAVFLEETRTKYIKDSKQYDNIILFSKRQNVQEKVRQWRLITIRYSQSSQRENKINAWAKMNWSKIPVVKKDEVCTSRYAVEYVSSEEDGNDSMIV